MSFIFKKRALYGHHGYPGRRMISTRSLDKNTVGSRFTTELRSRIFGCKSNRCKTSTI